MATTRATLQRPPVARDADGDGTMPNPPVTGRRRRIIIPIVAVVVILGLIFGIRYLVFAAHHVSTDDAQIGGNITTVAPRVKGQVTGVYVADNQYVHKGDVLVKLDDRDLAVAVQQAQAALAQAIASQQAAERGVPLQSALTAAQTAQAQAGIAQAGGQAATAQARVASANAGLTAARDRVAEAQAQAAAATSAAVKAKQDEDRARQLVAEGAISQSAFDAAKAAADAAVANENAALHNIAVATAGVAQAQQEIAQSQGALAQAQAGQSASSAQLLQAQTGTQQTSIKVSQADTASAQVKAARAQLAAAQLQLSYATIKASVDGTISKKSVNVGDNLSVGQPLMAIAETQTLWIDANLKETQITNVRAGQPVDIKVDAFPHQQFTGKVLSLSPATGATFALIPPDNASGNFTKVVQRVPVRIAVDDPAHLLKQGLSVEVTIDTTNH